MNTAALWIAIVSSIIAGVFAAAQMSLRTASRSKLKELSSHNGLKKRMAPILDDTPAHALTAELARVFFSLVVVVAAFVWSSGVGEISALTWPSLALAAGLSIVLIVIASAAIPMSIANHADEHTVVRLSRLIRAAHALLSPVLPLLRITDEIVRRLVAAGDDSHDEELERELLSVVSEAEQERDFGQAERHMIRAVVDFSTRQVDEVMTPRTEMEGIEKTDDLLVIREFINEAGHSRIPVYEEDLDHIVGVLYAKDLLDYLARDAAEFRIDEVLREARFVPETKPIAEMLLEFQRDKVHLAIVLDEYGGTAGLVTIEDVIEEIVGEIQDEFEPADEAPPEIVIVDEARSLEVDARASINDVNDRLEALGVSLPEDDDYDTVGGFVLTELGRMPDEGETFRRNGFLVTVLGAEPTRVTRVRIDFDAAKGEEHPDESVGASADS